MTSIPTAGQADQQRGKGQFESGAGSLTLEIRFLDVVDDWGAVLAEDVPHVVTVMPEVEVPIERTVKGKTVFEVTGYVPVHVLRRATRDEVNQWKER